MFEEENTFNHSSQPSRKTDLQKQGLFEDGFDQDYLGDDEDRAYLQSLTELEREKILAERHRKREEKIKENNLLRNYHERREIMDKKQTEMDKMVSERHNRKKRDLEDTGDEHLFANYDNFDGLRPESDSDYSDEDGPRMLGKPEKRIKRAREGKRANKHSLEEEEEPDRDITAEDVELKNICLLRKFLVSISSHLYFKEAVKGCLVKVSFKSSQDRIDYRIGEIVDVVERPQTYKVEEKDINKYLIIKMGNEEKEFKILFISNKPMGGIELSPYLKELSSLNLPVPQLYQVKERAKRLESLLKSKYTAKEIETLVEKRKLEKMAKTNNPREKRRILEDRLAKMEYAQFEKPTIKNKEDMKTIKKEIKKLDREIDEEIRVQTKEEQPIVVVKKSDPYTFGSHKAKTGESVIHTRTIPKLLNMWSIGTIELKYDCLKQ